MKAKRRTVPTIVIKRRRVAQLREVNGKKQEILVAERLLGGAKPIFVFERRTDGPRCFRNGVELIFPVRKYYVADAAHSRYAHSLTRSFHGPFRSSYFHAEHRLKKLREITGEKR